MSSALALQQEPVFSPEEELAAYRDRLKSLSFISFDEGRMDYWAPSLPDTDVWYVHYVRGRSYAIELMEYLKIHQFESEKTLVSAILMLIIERGYSRNDGIEIGFLDAISEQMATGSVS